MAKTRLTKKEILAELYKCVSDPCYFIETYAKIQHPVRGSIPFKTFEYQKDLIKSFVEHRFNIVLKGRQLGVTTVAAAYIAWFILFHKDKNVLIVATKQDVAKNMIRAIRNILKYLPEWLLLSKISIDNKQSIELANGSRAKAVTTSGDVGRSEAVSLMVIDEVAHIKNMDEIWIGLWPTVSAGGRIALLSTPNGTGNFFHKMYMQALNGENNFNCRFGTYINPNDASEVITDKLPWWVHPEHDLEWFKRETAGKSPREIAQEYLCSFNASGDTFISPETLSNLELSIKEPLQREYNDRNLWIWKRAEPGGRYIIPTDVSRGDSRDYTAFHVIRIDGERLEQVAEYKGKITPDILGLLLVQVSREYNNATIAPENNSGWSGQTVLKIKEQKYPHIYYAPKDKRVQVDQYYAEMHGLQPGYTITSLNRKPMLGKMEQYLRLEHIKVYSSRLLDELKTFIWNNDRPEASRSAHDDLVLSLAGGIWIREESFMYYHRGSDMAEALIAGISNSKVPLSEYRNSYDEMHNRARVVAHVTDQNKIILGDGNEVKLDWLFRG